MSTDAMVFHSAVYRFGEYEVRPEAAVLQHGSKTVHLEPKVLQILVYLLEHRDRVVTKRELLDAVWEEVYVTENALTKAIGKLRQALDDHPHDPRFIQTVHTLGYRFVATVHTEVDFESPAGADDPSEESPSRAMPVIAGKDVQPNSSEMAAGSQRSHLVPAIATSIVVILGLLWLWTDRKPSVPAEAPSQPIRSLAVLPLDNLTGDREQEYLVDAIHDALIGELAQLHPLRVISRQSTLPYRGGEESISKIADDLAVEAIIEGTVLRSGDRVRVSAQLILAGRDEHLWAGSFERNAGDVLALVSEIAEAIVEDIEIVVSPERRARLSERRSLSPEVEDAYLRARYATSLSTFSSLEQAKNLFADAIALDPTFARAHSGLAVTNFLMAMQGMAPRLEAAFACKSAALRALETEPGLPEALGVLGLVHLYFDWDWAAASRLLERAIELGPHDALVRHGYGDLLLVMGKAEESLEQVKLGRLYDPASQLAVVPVIGHLILVDRYDEAIEEITALLDSSSGRHVLRNFWSTALWAKGKEQESIALLREQWSVSRPELIAAIDRGFEIAGPKGAMLAIAEGHTVLEPDLQPGSDMIARYFARAGDVDRAFEYLNRAVDTREPGLLHVRFVPDFDSLRSDRRYQELLTRIGLPTDPVVTPQATE